MTDDPYPKPPILLFGEDAIEIRRTDSARWMVAIPEDGEASKKGLSTVDLLLIHSRIKQLRKINPKIHHLRHAERSIKRAIIVLRKKLAKDPFGDSDSDSDSD